MTSSTSLDPFASGDNFVQQIAKARNNYYDKATTSSFVVPVHSPSLSTFGVSSAVGSKSVPAQFVGGVASTEGSNSNAMMGYRSEPLLNASSNATNVGNRSVRFADQDFLASRSLSSSSGIPKGLDGQQRRGGGGESTVYFYNNNSYKNQNNDDYRYGSSAQVSDGGGGLRGSESDLRTLESATPRSSSNSSPSFVVGRNGGVLPSSSTAATASMIGLGFERRGGGGGSDPTATMMGPLTPSSPSSPLCPQCQPIIQHIQDSLLVVERKLLDEIATLRSALAESDAERQELLELVDGAQFETDEMKKIVIRLQTEIASAEEEAESLRSEAAIFSRESQLKGRKLHTESSIQFEMNRGNLLSLESSERRAITATEVSYRYLLRCGHAEHTAGVARRRAFESQQKAQQIARVGFKNVSSLLNLLLSGSATTATSGSSAAVAANNSTVIGSGSCSSNGFDANESDKKNSSSAARKHSMAILSWLKLEAKGEAGRAYYLSSSAAAVDDEKKTVRSPTLNLSSSSASFSPPSSPPFRGGLVPRSTDTQLAELDALAEKDAASYLESHDDYGDMDFVYEKLMGSLINASGAANNSKRSKQRAGEEETHNPPPSAAIVHELNMRHREEIASLKKRYEEELALLKKEVVVQNSLRKYNSEDDTDNDGKKDSYVGNDKQRDLLHNASYAIREVELSESEGRLRIAYEANKEFYAYVSETSAALLAAVVARVKKQEERGKGEVGGDTSNSTSTGGASDQQTQRELTLLRRLLMEAKEDAFAARRECTEAQRQRDELAGQLDDYKDELMRSGGGTPLPPSSQTASASAAVGFVAVADEGNFATTKNSTTIVGDQSSSSIGALKSESKATIPPREEVVALEQKLRLSEALLAEKNKLLSETISKYETERMESARLRVRIGVLENLRPSTQRGVGGEGNGGPPEAVVSSPPPSPSPSIQSPLVSVVPPSTFAPLSSDAGTAASRSGGGRGSGNEAVIDVAASDAASVAGPMAATTDQLNAMAQTLNDLKHMVTHIGQVLHTARGEGGVTVKNKREGESLGLGPPTRKGPTAELTELNYANFSFSLSPPSAAGTAHQTPTNSDYEHLKIHHPHHQNHHHQHLAKTTTAAVGLADTPLSQRGGTFPSPSHPPSSSGMDPHRIQVADPALLDLSTMGASTAAPSPVAAAKKTKRRGAPREEDGDSDEIGGREEATALKQQSRRRRRHNMKTHRSDVRNSQTATNTNTNTNSSEDLSMEESSSYCSEEEEEYSQHQKQKQLAGISPSANIFLGSNGASVPLTSIVDSKQEDSLFTSQEETFNRGGSTVTNDAALTKGFYNKNQAKNDGNKRSMANVRHQEKSLDALTKKMNLLLSWLGMDPTVVGEESCSAPSYHNNDNYYYSHPYNNGSGDGGAFSSSSPSTAHYYYYSANNRQPHHEGASDENFSPASLSMLPPMSKRRDSVASAAQGAGAATVSNLLGGGGGGGAAKFSVGNCSLVTLADGQAHHAEHVCDETTAATTEGAVCIRGGDGDHHVGRGRQLSLFEEDSLAGAVNGKPPSAASAAIVETEKRGKRAAADSTPLATSGSSNDVVIAGEKSSAAVVGIKSNNGNGATNTRTKKGVISTKDNSNANKDTLITVLLRSLYESQLSYLESALPHHQLYIGAEEGEGGAAVGAPNSISYYPHHNVSYPFPLPFTPHAFFMPVSEPATANTTPLLPSALPPPQRHSENKTTELPNGSNLGEEGEGASKQGTVSSGGSGVGGAPPPALHHQGCPSSTLPSSNSGDRNGGGAGGEGRVTGLPPPNPNGGTARENSAVYSFGMSTSSIAPPLGGIAAANNQSFATSLLHLHGLNNHTHTVHISATGASFAGSGGGGLGLGVGMGPVDEIEAAKKKSSNAKADGATNNSDAGGDADTTYGAASSLLGVGVSSDSGAASAVAGGGLPKPPYMHHLIGLAGGGGVGTNVAMVPLAPSSSRGGAPLPVSTAYHPIVVGGMPTMHAHPFYLPPNRGKQTKIVTGGEDQRPLHTTTSLYSFHRHAQADGGDAIVGEGVGTNKGEAALSSTAEKGKKASAKKEGLTAAEQNGPPAFGHFVEKLSTKDLPAMRLAIRNLFFATSHHQSLVSSEIQQVRRQLAALCERLGVKLNSSKNNNNNTAAAATTVDGSTKRQHHRQPEPQNDARRRNGNDPSTMITTTAAVISRQQSLDLAPPPPPRRDDGATNTITAKNNGGAGDASAGAVLSTPAPILVSTLHNPLHQPSISSSTAAAVTTVSNNDYLSISPRSSGSVHQASFFALDGSATTDAPLPLHHSTVAKTNSASLHVFDNNNNNSTLNIDDNNAYSSYIRSNSRIHVGHALDRHHHHNDSSSLLLLQNGGVGMGMDLRTQSVMTGLDGVSEGVGAEGGGLMMMSSTLSSSSGRRGSLGGGGEAGPSVPIDLPLSIDATVASAAVERPTEGTTAAHQPPNNKSEQNDNICNTNEAQRETHAQSNTHKNTNNTNHTNNRDTVEKKKNTPETALTNNRKALSIATVASANDLQQGGPNESGSSFVGSLPIPVALGAGDLPEDLNSSVANSETEGGRSFNTNTTNQTAITNTTNTYASNGTPYTLSSQQPMRYQLEMGTPMNLNFNNNNATTAAALPTTAMAIGGAGAGGVFLPHPTARMLPLVGVGVGGVKAGGVADLLVGVSPSSIGRIEFGGGVTTAAAQAATATQEASTKRPISTSPDPPPPPAPSSSTNVDNSISEGIQKELQQQFKSLLSQPSDQKPPLPPPHSTTVQNIVPTGVAVVAKTAPSQPITTNAPTPTLASGVAPVKSMAHSAFDDDDDDEDDDAPDGDVRKANEETVSTSKSTDLRMPTRAATTNTAAATTSGIANNSNSGTNVNNTNNTSLLIGSASLRMSSSSARAASKKIKSEGKDTLHDDNDDDDDDQTFTLAATTSSVNAATAAASSSVKAGTTTARANGAQHMPQQPTVSSSLVLSSPAPPSSALTPTPTTTTAKPPKRKQRSDWDSSDEDDDDDDDDDNIINAAAAATSTTSVTRAVPPPASVVGAAKAPVQQAAGRSNQPLNSIEAAGRGGVVGAPMTVNSSSALPTTQRREERGDKVADTVGSVPKNTQPNDSNLHHQDTDDDDDDEDSDVDIDTLLRGIISTSTPTSLRTATSKTKKPQQTEGQQRSADNDTKPRLSDKEERDEGRTRGGAAHVNAKVTNKEGSFVTRTASSSSSSSGDDGSNFYLNGGARGGKESNTSLPMSQFPKLRRVVSSSLSPRREGGGGGGDEEGLASDRKGVSKSFNNSNNACAAFTPITSADAHDIDLNAFVGLGAKDAHAPPPYPLPAANTVHTNGKGNLSALLMGADGGGGQLRNAPSGGNNNNSSKPPLPPSHQAQSRETAPPSSASAPPATKPKPKVFSVADILNSAPFDDSDDEYA